MNVDVRETVNSISAQIGFRIRTRREACGISQKTLADALSVSIWALESYESGETDLSPVHLLRVAHELDVTVDYFFGHASDSNSVSDANADEDTDGEKLAFVANESWKLREAFESIGDASVRSSILKLTQRVTEVDRS